MNNHCSQTLLAADEESAVRIINRHGSSPFLLIGDHAGNRVPASLASLGIGDAELARHIGWDIGIGDLGATLAFKLGAPFIRQTYSRLVIDCNREPSASDAIPETSDGTSIPANRGLTSADRESRISAIHEPYQASIAAELAARDSVGRDTILVSLHSFTPTMNGKHRPWHVGVLYSNGDPRFAKAVLHQLRQHADLVVGDNEPYAMDGIDFTVPLHAFSKRRPYVEIEIRQDLLTTPVQHQYWSDLMAAIFIKVAADPHF